MSYELIQIKELLDGAATEIVLNEPPANIVSSKMMSEISEALVTIQKDPQKKMILFSGEGKHFSFGASVEEHKPELVGDMMPSFHKLIGEILNCEVPTVAKVSGLCLGGGFEVAMACTFLFADVTAKFAVPEVQLAVFPPVASALLPRLVNDTYASQIILTGAQVSAEELSNFGMINKICEKGELDKTIASYFEEQLQTKSAKALRFAHQAARMSIVEHYNSHIGNLENLYLNELMKTSDAVEGIQSFIERRPPQWKDS